MGAPCNLAVVMINDEPLVELTTRLAIRLCVLTIRPNGLAAALLVLTTSSTNTPPTLIAALVMIYALLPTKKDT